MEVRAAETHKGLIASRKMLVAVRRYAGTTSVQPESTFALAKEGFVFSINNWGLAYPTFFRFSFRLQSEEDLD